MAETQTNLAWEALFDLSGTGPLYVRLTAAIRTAIRAGRLPLGAALPPSRALAADLGISRSTVTRAYGQLVTEGYLSGRTGSATRVCWSPEEGPAGTARHPAGIARHPVRYDLAECAPDFRAFPTPSRPIPGCGPCASARRTTPRPAACWRRIAGPRCWTGPAASAGWSWRTTTTPSSATTGRRCRPCTARPRNGWPCSAR